MDLQKLFKVIFIISRVVGGLGMFAGSLIMFFTSGFTFGVFAWSCGLVVANLEIVYNTCYSAWDFIQENI